ncbi:hypothetical protein ACFYXF_43875 [Streptomyces sp. NPDC002680]|uniref:hypothetical protein n=1 Tax=Streptomyces sp. NPDC002680 TaxID=3364659 RepID=UPI0036CBA8EF
MKRTLAMRCAAALVISAAATGCTAAATAVPTGGSASPDTGKVREPTDAEQVLVQRAENVLVKSCMEKAGFRYWIGPLPTVDDLKGGGYVLTDVDWAKRNGYGSRLREKAAELQRTDPNSKYANSLPQQDRARYSETLEGGPSAGMLTVDLPAGGTVRTPRHSCLTEAKGRLYGDFETWFKAEKTATNLTRLYVPDLLDDQRLVDALKKWSACMREAGHDYDDPTAIRNELPSLTKGLSPDAAFTAEVRLAVDEAECATGTSLSATAHDLEREYRDKLRGTYGDALTTYERMRFAALERAEDITGDTA